MRTRNRQNRHVKNGLYQMLPLPLSHLDEATELNHNDLLDISQKQEQGYVSKKIEAVTIANFIDAIYKAKRENGVVFVVAEYNQKPTDTFISINAIDAITVIHLLSPSICKGQEITIARTDYNINNIVLIKPIEGTINGWGYKQINYQESIRLISDGKDYQII